MLLIFEPKTIDLRVKKLFLLSFNLILISIYVYDNMWILTKNNNMWMWMWMWIWMWACLLFSCLVLCLLAFWISCGDMGLVIICDWLWPHYCTHFHRIHARAWTCTTCSHTNVSCSYLNPSCVWDMCKFGSQANSWSNGFF